MWGRAPAGVGGGSREAAHQLSIGAQHRDGGSAARCLASARGLSEQEALGHRRCMLRKGDMALSQSFKVGP